MVEGADAPRRLHLVDASIYVFRAWFAYPASLTDATGRPVNAAFGFATLLVRWLARMRPATVAVAFDESLSTCFRNDFYADYKRDRMPAPPELKRQFAWCRRFVEAAGMQVFASERFEADDFIGTLASKAHASGWSIDVVSRDKDLVQVLREGDRWGDLSDARSYSAAHIQRRFGLRAPQIPDWLGLRGDAVDAIPGVPGIGDKTARVLLQTFASLDNLYARLDEVEALDMRGARRVRALLQTYRAQAYLSRALATVYPHVPLDTTLDALHRRRPDMEAMKDLLARLGRGAGLARQATDSYEG